MRDMVSVVIPTYNRKDTIIGCVNSVLAQTYPNIEVIVVDDGSDDETEKIFDNFNDKRVKFYRYKLNKGACYARNYGADRASGVYIAFQDSDDQWLPNKLENQISFLNVKNVDFVFCGMNRINFVSNKNYYYPAIDFDEDGDVLEQLLIDNVISTQTILVRRVVMDKIRFDTSFKRYQDWDFSLQTVLNGVKISYLKMPLVNSEVQANSISANIKAGAAYEHLYNKYEKEFIKYPKALASINRKMGISYSQIDRSKTKKYLWESLRNEKDLKTMVRLFLYYVHLWRGL